MRCNVITRLETAEAVRVHALQRPVVKAKWRRLLGISAMLLALGLIVCSIYMHLRQKHHLGRLYFEQSNKNKDNNDDSSGSSEQISEDYHIETGTMSYEIVPGVVADSPYYSAEDETATKHLESKELFEPIQIEISEACMQCICEVATECKPVKCHDIPCGPYRISRPYWKDATIDVDIDDNDPNAYENCTNNVNCASRVVAAYIKKYTRDCNNDGIIDCSDYIALHILGPTGCLNDMGLLPIYEQRMENCFYKNNLTAY